MPRHRKFWSYIAFLGICLLALVAYWPGLHGGFLFDDFGNLPNLGATGPVDNWSAFWRYITSGIADPTGRPVTLLMFLFDSRDWPASPLPFKRSNLILHIFNGALLALLLRELGRYSFSQVTDWRICLAAALGAGFWLLHPLLVSTALYVIQREAMLPATFILLGLLGWLRGRVALLQGRHHRGLVWMVASLGGCTLLGVLSKANGILLPALALAVDYTLLRLVEEPARRTVENRLYYANVMRVMAWLPASLIAAYLLYEGWHGMLQGASGQRPWTLGQRLLTEPRVLMRYLDLLWLPRPFTPGLFNDQIRASTSLWIPSTTIPSMLTVLGLIIGACLLRRRWPPACAAILFFFVGQSLESSTLSLELYFEHRNYLPALLMFWPLALWLCGVYNLRAPALNTDSSLRGSFADRTLAIHNVRGSISGPPWPTGNIARIGIAIVIVLGLALMTRARADLWGNTQDQALLWATLNPVSPRAQTHAAQAEMAAGRYVAAEQRLTSALAQHADEVQLALNLIDAQCHLGGVSADALHATQVALQTTADPGSLLVKWFGASIDGLKTGTCAGLTSASINNLLRAAFSNPKLASVSGRRQDLYNLQGRLELSGGNGPAALAAFNLALDQQVQPAAALEQAATLGAAGYPRLGLDHLDHFEFERSRQEPVAWGMPRVHAWIINRQHYWPHELAQLRHQLMLDANAANTNTVDPNAARSKTR